jgi:hypothetical protein
MGTRNLTMVISDGKPIVAQYGQWDGYPSGQGTTCLEFLKAHKPDEIKKTFKNVKFINKRKQKEIDTFLNSIGCKDGWMDMDQAGKYHAAYPFLTRDNGANILNLLFESKERTKWINDNSEFAADGLFCEWAYVIDLDKGTFEVYKGFNQKPLTPKDRFFYLQDKTEHGYSPVKKLTSFSLKKLPTVERFVEKCDKLAEVEA